MVQTTGVRKKLTERDIEKEIPMKFACKQGGANRSVNLREYFKDLIATE